MTTEELKQLKERVYASGSSLFPIDVFFNDIRDNKDPKYNKDRAYEDLKLIVDEIYRLRDIKTPKKPKGLSICPNCQNHLYINQKYCDKCGQKLDWSEVKDEIQSNV